MFPELEAKFLEPQASCSQPQVRENKGLSHPLSENVN